MRREQVHQLMDTLLDLGQVVFSSRMPDEARQHFKNARRETLLGVRAMVDGALARLDAEPQDEAAKGARSIPVEEE